MPKEKIEKIIEYGPAEKSTRGLLIAIFSIFLITWLAVIAGGVYLSGQIRKNSTSNDVKDQLAKIQNDIGTLNKKVDENGALTDRIIALEDAVASHHSKPDNQKNISADKIPVPEIPTPAIPDASTSKNEAIPYIAAPAGQDTRPPLTAINASDNDVSSLKGEPENLEKKVAKPEINEEKSMNPVVIATVNLKDRVEKLLPYESDLNLLKKLSYGDETLAGYIINLESNLKQGHSNLDQLKYEFQKLAGKIVNASKQSKEDAFWNNALSTLSESVTVRKVGPDVEGESAEAVVARAEAALQQNNIRDAVNELTKLQGKPADVSSSWLNKATRYIAIEDTLADMYAHVTRVTAAKTSNIP